MAATTQTNYDRHLLKYGRLKAELEDIEVRAGIRERHAAFVEYNTDADLEKLYFSVRNKKLRKELIAHCRSLRGVAQEATKAQISDAETGLAILENRGSPIPWAMPGVIACGAVWFGYSLWSMPGALAGAVAGVFAGVAYIAKMKNAWRRAVTYAKAELEELRSKETGDRIRYHGLPFSETEAESGGEDEGRQPEPKIHWYARLGDVEGIKREIASGVSLEMENNVDWGSRPLHRAAANGNVEAIKLLIAAGADVSAKNTLHGWLPIDYAARRGCAEAIHMLINAGSPFDAKDKYGLETLHRAAEAGDPECVTALLDAGAKVDARGGPYQTQPIHEAAKAGNFLVVETLLARGANPSASNTHGVRPLDFACYEKHSDAQRTIRILEVAGGLRSRGMGDLVT